jgi:hypothetical protein
MSISFSKVFKELQEFSASLFGRSDLTNEEKFAAVQKEAKELVNVAWELGEDGIKLVLPGAWASIFDFISDNGPIANFQEGAEDMVAGLLAEAAYRAAKAVREALEGVGIAV